MIEADYVHVELKHFRREVVADRLLDKIQNREKYNLTDKQFNRRITELARVSNSIEAHSSLAKNLNPELIKSVLLNYGYIKNQRGYFVKPEGLSNQIL
jgi:hypothetical protein